MPRQQRRAAERAQKKRNRGKQTGSPGAAMRWEVPDRTEDHYPPGECASIWWSSSMSRCSGASS